MVLTALASAGTYGVITVGFHGRSVGSSIFALVVIALFGGLAVGGLNQLRGVRTERRPDGTAVLKLPRLIPNRGGWWRILPATDIASLSLVYVGRRSRLYNLGVTLAGGTTLTCGAISVDAPRSVSIPDTRAVRMVEQIRQDLGLNRD